MKKHYLVTIHYPAEQQLVVEADDVAEAIAAVERTNYWRESFTIDQPKELPGIVRVENP